MSDNKSTNHVFIFPEGSINKNKDKDKDKTKETLIQIQKQANLLKEKINNKEQ